MLKAFNTTFAGTLSARKVGPITTTVLVAGDDAAAKAALIEAVKAGGVEAVDVGALNRARELEAMGFLQIKLAASELVGWTGGLRPRTLTAVTNRPAGDDARRANVSGAHGYDD